MTKTAPPNPFFISELIIASTLSKFSNLFGLELEYNLKLTKKE